MMKGRATENFDSAFDSRDITGAHLPPAPERNPAFSAIGGKIEEVVRSGSETSSHPEIYGQVLALALKKLAAMKGTWLERNPCPAEMLRVRSDAFRALSAEGIGSNAIKPSLEDDLIFTAQNSAIATVKAATKEVETSRKNIDSLKSRIDEISANIKLVSSIAPDALYEAHASGKLSGMPSAFINECGRWIENYRAPNSLLYSTGIRSREVHRKEDFERLIKSWLKNTTDEVAELTREHTAADNALSVGSLKADKPGKMFREEYEKALAISIKRELESIDLNGGFGTCSKAAEFCRKLEESFIRSANCHLALTDIRAIFADNVQEQQSKQSELEYSATIVRDTSDKLASLEGERLRIQEEYRRAENSAALARHTAALDAAQGNVKLAREEAETGKKRFDTAVENFATTVLNDAVKDYVMSLPKSMLELDAITENLQVRAARGHEDVITPDSLSEVMKKAVLLAHKECRQFICSWIDLELGEQVLAFMTMSSSRRSALPPAFRGDELKRFKELGGSAIEFMIEVKPTRSYGSYDGPVRGRGPVEKNTIQPFLDGTIPWTSVTPIYSTRSSGAEWELESAAGSFTMWFPDPGPISREHLELVAGIFNNGAEARTTEGPWSRLKIKVQLLVPEA